MKINIITQYFGTLILQRDFDADSLNVRPRKNTKFKIPIPCTLDLLYPYAHTCMHAQMQRASSYLNIIQKTLKPERKRERRALAWQTSRFKRIYFFPLTHFDKRAVAEKLSQAHSLKVSADGGIRIIFRGKVCIYWPHAACKFFGWKIHFVGRIYHPTATYVRGPRVFRLWLTC